MSEVRHVVLTGSSGAQAHAREIDRVGEASAIAQQLPQIITTYDRLRCSKHRLHALIDGDVLVGILKIGTKKLFVRDRDQALVECEPLCVLDFYVEERRQRQGLGNRLFNAMLAHEQIHPGKLAYDRPSSKLYPFLARHYKLTNPVLQTNNYAIFDHFFLSEAELKLEPQQPQPMTVAPSTQGPSVKIVAPGAEVRAPAQADDRDIGHQARETLRWQPPPHEAPGSRPPPPPQPHPTPSPSFGPALPSPPSRGTRNHNATSPGNPLASPYVGPPGGAMPDRFSKAQILREFAAQKAAGATPQKGYTHSYSTGAVGPF